jgi:hypothetical protein
LNTKTGIHCDACHHLHHFFVIHGFVRAFPVVGHMFPLELAMDTTVTNRAACPPGRQTARHCQGDVGHARTCKAGFITYKAVRHGYPNGLVWNKDTWE